MIPYVPTHSAPCSDVQFSVRITSQECIHAA